MNGVSSQLQLCEQVTDQGGNFAADVAEMGGHAELAAWLRAECSGARARSLAALGLTEPADSELIGQLCRGVIG